MSDSDDTDDEDEDDEPPQQSFKSLLLMRLAPPSSVQPLPRPSVIGGDLVVVQQAPLQQAPLQPVVVVPRAIPSKLEVKAFKEVKPDGGDLDQDLNRASALTPAGATLQEKLDLEGRLAQYVNLDEQVVDVKAKRPEFRRSVFFKVQAGWKDPSDLALTGEELELALVAGNDNKTGLTSAESAKLGATDGRGRFALDVSGWTAAVELRLSTYGGDRLHVKATGGADTAPMNGPTYEVWRRVWYQLVVMSDAQGGNDYDIASSVFDDVRKAYQRVFIDLVRDPGTRLMTPPDHAPFTEIGEGESPFATYFHPVPSRKPFTCVVVSASNCTNDVLARATVSATLTAFGSRSWTDVDLEGAFTTLDRELDDLTTVGALRGGPQGGVHLVVVPTYAGRPMTPGWLTQAWGTTTPLTLAVPDDASPLPGGTNPVEVRIELLAAKLDYIGLGGGGRFVYLNYGHLNALLLQYPKPQGAPAYRAMTIAHELGHALGLVKLPKRPTATFADWDTWIDDGAHCKLKACVMYSTDDSTQTAYFHGDALTASCHDYLRRLDLSRTNLGAHWS